ncbi:hypothetical protein ACIO6U_10315 [Streptomyces sp. NPDC087422]|uniref:hypothetical protein n=1 Tax=Streptomyces sp. NPDC087422 TaxID=3365786 RepID=UPI0037F1250F
MLVVCADAGLNQTIRMFSRSVTACGAPVAICGLALYEVTPPSVQLGLKYG